MERQGCQLSYFLIHWQKGLLLNTYTQVKAPDKALYYAEVEHPGLALSGYLDGFARHRPLVFDRIEIQYLRKLGAHEAMQRLKGIIDEHTPCVILAHNQKPTRELIQVCRKMRTPLLISQLEAQDLLAKLILALKEALAPHCELHATLMDVFGLGVMLRGSSGVGKSETALGLIERGHRLVGDDLVQVKNRDGELIGTSSELTRHHLEIRGIGIINVAHLYGMVCIEQSKKVDIIVELEIWNTNREYDRLGLEWQMTEVLGVTIPHHLLPVKTGRDLVLLIETIALNHRLRSMGYNSAKELERRLQRQMKKR